jgi:hypothetical protein
MKTPVRLHRAAPRMTAGEAQQRECLLEWRHDDCAEFPRQSGFEAAGGASASIGLDNPADP